MDLRVLQQFLELADQLHFARAAGACHISPSTLTRSIHRLEETLGVTLFERDQRKVALTRAGSEFREQARQITALWQQSLARYSDQQLLQGELRLFCSVTAAYSHLPPLLDRFRAEQPRVEIRLSTGDAGRAVEQVLNDSVDLSIAALPDPVPEKLAFQSLGPVPLSVIVPRMACPTRELVSQPEIDWSQVPFILPEHGPARRTIETWWQSLGLKQPRIYATVSGHEAIVSMVAVGCGLGIAPDVVIDNSPGRERIERLTTVDPIAPFDVGLCCRKQRLQDPLVAAFWQSLQPDKVSAT